MLMMIRGPVGFVLAICLLGEVSLFACDVAVVKKVGEPTPLMLSDEAYRGEFRYLCGVYGAIDLEGAPVKTDGWTSNIPEAEWPFMGLCYFGYACGQMAKYDPPMRAEALERMRWILETLQRPRMTGFMSEHFGDPFPEEGMPGASVFVHGHFLQLATRYRALTGDERFDPVMRRVAEALAGAFERSRGGLLASYPGMWWVSDNFPAVSALIRYDGLFGTDHGAFAPVFVSRIKSDYLDPETGLFATYVDPATVTVLQGPRGISVMYGLHFLKDIDAEFAKSQYKVAVERLVRSGLGFAAVLEFPPGVDGEGDIDSGSLFMGIGPSASGFAIAAAAVMGDPKVANQLLMSTVAVGMPQWEDDRLIYKSMPPVGQAVILFGKTGLRVLLLPPPD